MSSVNESLANILRLKAKHQDALTHLMHCISGTDKPTKNPLKKLPVYLKRANFSKATMRDVERLIEEQRPLADLQVIMTRVAKWE